MDFVHRNKSIQPRAWLAFLMQFSHVLVAFFLSGAVVNTLIPQQVIEAQGASIRQLFDFSATVFSGVEKLTVLNLQTVSTTLAENQAIVNQALVAKPEELLALSANLIKPTAEKFAAYSRQVQKILADTQGVLTSSAQSQLGESQREAKEFIANLAKNSPLSNSVVVAE
jgi:phasin family protein